jgi:hypothetical protein
MLKQIPPYDAIGVLCDDLQFGTSILLRFFAQRIIFGIAINEVISPMLKLSTKNIKYVFSIFIILHNKILCSVNELILFLSEY